MHYANDDFEESEEQSHLQNLASPPRKKQRAVNQYATVSNRLFAAIRQETVLAIQNFLTQRIVPAITSSIEEIATVFMSASPRDMAKSAQSQLEKLKMNSAGAQLMDDCIDLFIQASLLSGKQDLRQAFKCISENTISAQLTVLINLVLTAIPHSMVVERTVSHSHYNILRNDKRLSMSLQSANNRLLVVLNGVGTAFFDPRPVVAHIQRASLKKEAQI